MPILEKKNWDWEPIHDHTESGWWHGRGTQVVGLWKSCFFPNHYVGKGVMGILLHVWGLYIDTHFCWIYAIYPYKFSLFLCSLSFKILYFKGNTISKHLQANPECVQVSAGSLWAFWGDDFPDLLHYQPRQQMDNRKQLPLASPSSFHSNLLHCHWARSPKGGQSFSTSHPSHILPFACQPSA